MNILLPFQHFKCFCCGLTTFTVYCSGLKMGEVELDGLKNLTWKRFWNELLDAQKVSFLQPAYQKAGVKRNRSVRVKRHKTAYACYECSTATFYHRIDCDTEWKTGTCIDIIKMTISFCMSQSLKNKSEPPLKDLPIDNLYVRLHFFFFYQSICFLKWDRSTYIVCNQVRMVALDSII